MTKRKSEGVWTRDALDDALSRAKERDDDEVRACFCVGPQNGDQACPCQMRNMQIWNGRYVTIIDHGPAK